MTLDLRGMTPLVQVFDMPTSVRFYRDLLGFELLSSSGAGENSDWVLLRRDEIHLMLNTAYESDTRPPAPDPARVASHEDASLFFSCLDVDAAYEYLRRRGVTVRQPPTNQAYGMRQLYVADPDGYVLCFQWPCSDETGARWRAWYGDEATNAEPSQTKT